MDAAKASQVDFIERTLIGEVMDCEEEGLGQAEAVGVVIARRLMAVSNAAREQKEVEAKNEAINQENNKVLERSDLKGDFIKNTEARLRGRRDFGRPPPPFPTSLPFMAGAEVVSRNLQFSVWQPNVKKFYNTSTDVHNANIPNYRYPIFGALPENDLRDQIRGLCPEIPKNTKNGTKVNVGGENLWKETFSNSQVWSHISDLALQIVNDPEAYLKRYTLKPPAAPKDHVYFYTHGPDLPFAVETHVDVIHDNVTNKDLPLRKKVVTNPYDPCNKFRTFAPKDVGEYENKSR